MEQALVRVSLVLSGVAKYVLDLHLPAHALCELFVRFGVWAETIQKRRPCARRVHLLLTVQASHPAAYPPESASASPEVSIRAKPTYVLTNYRSLSQPPERTLVGGNSFEETMTPTRRKGEKAVVAKPVNMDGRQTKSKK